MKAKLFICNAFSLSMLDREHQRGTPIGYEPYYGDAPHAARVPRPVDDPIELIESWKERGGEVDSALGHASSQALFEAALGSPVRVNRQAIKLGEYNHALIGQVTDRDGKPVRLPEGATELPEGVVLQWWVI